MKANRQRTGVECVELAVTLPFLILVAFTCIEFCYLISFQQTSFRIAFATARETGQSGLTNDQTITLAKQKLSDARVTGKASIDTQPSLMADFEQVTVNVHVECKSSFSFIQILKGRIVTGSATTIRPVNKPPPPPDDDDRQKGKRKGRERDRDSD